MDKAEVRSISKLLVSVTTMFQQVSEIGYHPHGFTLEVGEPVADMPGYRYLVANIDKSEESYKKSMFRDTADEDVRKLKAYPIDVIAKLNGSLDRSGQALGVFPDVVFIKYQWKGKETMARFYDTGLEGLRLFVAPDFTVLTCSDDILYDNSNNYIVSDPDTHIRQIGVSDILKDATRAKLLSPDCVNLHYAVRDELVQMTMDWNSAIEDPMLLEDEREAEEGLNFVRGSEDALREVLTHVATASCIDDRFRSIPDKTLRVITATDEEPALLRGDDYYDDSEFVDALYEDFSYILDTALEENTPSGWRWEYNDGPYNRRSGYDKTPESLEILPENISPSEHEISRSIIFLRQWCKERGIALPELLKTSAQQ